MSSSAIRLYRPRTAGGRDAGTVVMALALLALAVGGCARTRTVADDDLALPERFPNHTAAQIRQQLSMGSAAIEAFKGKASFSVNTPVRSGRFSADISARAGDSLYMTISPGLGIEAARALVTKDSLYLYDRINNRVTYGSLEQASGLLGLPIAADDLFRGLLGLTVPEADVAWALDTDDAFYYLTNPEGTRRYTIDPTVWRVARYEERSLDGTLIEERRYSGFDQFGAWYLPREVSFRRPQDESTASLFYRSLDLNPEPLTFNFRVSSSAERVEAGSE